MSNAKPLDTANVRLSFGKHKGQMITRVPLSYLRFMINESTKMCDYARAELERRGGELPKVEISGHAIDRASMRVGHIWRETRGADEGLYTWLSRMVLEALEADNAIHGDDGGYAHNGVKWVIAQGDEFPVLKTCMPLKGKDNGESSGGN